MAVDYDPELSRVDLFWLFFLPGEDLESVIDSLENDLGYDVEILFISHFNNITFEQYLEQPMSVLTRKLLRSYWVQGAEFPGCD